MCIRRFVCLLVSHPCCIVCVFHLLRFVCYWLVPVRVTQGDARTTTVYTRKQTDRRTALPIALEQARRLRVYLTQLSRMRDFIKVAQCVVGGVSVALVAASRRRPPVLANARGLSSTRAYHCHESSTYLTIRRSSSPARGGLFHPSAANPHGPGPRQAGSRLNAACPPSQSTAAAPG